MRFALAGLPFGPAVFPFFLPFEDGLRGRYIDIAKHIAGCFDDRSQSAAQLRPSLRSAIWMFVNDLELWERVALFFG